MGIQPQTFGKPKFILILGLCILVLLLCPYVGRQIGYTVWHGLGFAVIWCGTVALAFVVRYRIYTKELAAFEIAGKPQQRIQVTQHSQIEGLTLTGANSSATALESLLTRQKMRWGNAGDSYLCFTNLFSAWPIAVRIGPVPSQDHTAILDFEFSDRFLSPLMISYVQNKFAVEMSRMFKVFRSELPKRG